MMPVGRELPQELPSNVRKSAVLLLIYPENKDFKLVMIERSKDGGLHSGQMAFPGGKVEEFDSSLEATALREANEEVDLDEEIVKIAGRLTPMFIPVSNFQVFPIIGFCEERPSLKASDDEVAMIYRFSFQEDFPKKEWREFFSRGELSFKIKAPAYHFMEGKLIWGATAMILAELEWLWIEFNEFNAPL